MKRNFCIGSQWLYYKIYTGVKTADIILGEQLYPIIKDLLEQKIITQWFFIRYKDPEEHLRIRFYCENSNNITVVIAKLFPVLTNLLEKDLIWRIQTDTYQREIERYGLNTIEASEKLFYCDSEMILNYISLKPYFIKDDTQLLFSFLSIDSLLNSFSLTSDEKMELLNNLQLSFKTEFSADKTLKKEFDKHFRDIAPEMENFIKGNSKTDFEEIYAIIEDKATAAKPIVKTIKSTIQVPLSDFLQSHIHMMINRQFTSRQRQYECLIYDHLHRYYKKIRFAS